jgi:pyruvate,orthophosphate dikinase
MLDPELYKFVPSIEAVARELGEVKAKGLDQKLLADKEKVLRRVRVLVEYNPMLGNRGVRCGISFPEIYDMQIQAIFEAAAIALREKSTSGRRSWCPMSAPARSWYGSNPGWRRFIKRWKSATM